MSAYYVDKPVSLVERKKQQWAQERDELANLSVPWGNNERPKLTRNRFKRFSAEPIDGNRRDRRSSLPPLSRNQTYHSVEKLERDMGGETSGYGSDVPHNTPEYFQPAGWNHQAGYDSSTSCRDDRLKWGDRGVAVGKFWVPNEFSEYEKKLIMDTPGWVKRGLQRDTELVVSNSSPAESPEQGYVEERPFTSSTVSQNKSYIRGQNAHIDPRELAERERRRQLALAHQEAIKQQLEENERKKREEREKKLKEEREEELRIEKERQLEIKRKELELKRLEEKREKEKMRKEALQEVLELAEKEAKARKQKTLKQNINENIKESDKLASSIDALHENNLNNKEVTTSPTKNDSSTPKLINSSINKDPTTPTHTTYENDNHVATESNNFVINSRTATPKQQLPIFSDNLALVVQTPLETLQGMQFAVLMPSVGSNISQTLPIAVPLTVATPRTENRVLTPSLYRNRNVCDSSTQTDFVDDKNDVAELRDKMACIDLNYDNRNRKARSRNEDRVREVVEMRPKWGANRPPTRYLTQSEKDPLYQRRKLRQKMRQIKVYDDKNNNDYSPHSSDDSQRTSPVYQRKKGFIEKRSGRALWRKNDMYSRSLNIYQTEIVPIETDKNQIYYKPVYSCRCCCQCVCDTRKNIKLTNVLKTTCEQNCSNKDSEKSLSECGTYTEQNSDILDNLNTLQSNLLLKQEELNTPGVTPRKHL